MDELEKELIRKYILKSREILNSTPSRKRIPPFRVNSDMRSSDIYGNDPLVQKIIRKYYNLKS